MSARIRAATFALALLAAPFALLAAQQAPLRLTMDEAVRRALQSGEEVQVAQAGVDEARGQVREAYAGALPEVRASLTYQRTFASVWSGGYTGPALGPFAPDTTAPLSERIRYLENEYPNAVLRGLGELFAATPFGQQNTYTAAVTVGQVLYQGGKVAAGVRGAHAYERAAAAQLEETRRDIVYRVKQAYLDALFAGRLLDIAIEGEAQTDSQLARVEMNHNVGAAADYDLLRAQVEAANQEPQVIAARNQNDLAVLELKRLVNVPVNQPLELDAGALAGDSVPEVDLSRVALNDDQRALVDAAEATVAFRREAVRVYAGDLYPSLRFDMSYGGQAFPAGTLPGYGDFRRDWNARLTVSMPLFDGFRTRGQVAQAKAELSRAEAQLAQTRESVAIEAEQARDEVVRARALLAARQQTVSWAARAHHLATVRFANGIATSLEVSDARLALQQAEVNEAQALRDYLLGLAALERAVGHDIRGAPAGRAAQTAPAGTGTNRSGVRQ